MKVLYIVEMNEDNKAGLFNATHDRIANNKGKVNSSILTLKFYDGILLGLVKRILNKKVTKKRKDVFTHQGISYENFYIKRTIFNTLMEKNGFDFFLYILFILKTRKKFKDIDLISAHWGHYQGSLSYYIKRFFSIPYVLTLHGSDVHSAPHICKAYKKQIIRNIQNSNYNIFVSKQLENIAGNLCSLDENSTVIYNSVNINNFYPYSVEDKKDTKLKLKLSGKIIGYVGNLVDVKGVDRLPEICRHLKSIYKEDFTCLIIGEGELRDTIKKQFEYHGIKHQLLGKKEQNEIPSLMNIMDVLMLPSRREGLGNVLLEAQACGIPVVGSDAGGIPEAIVDSSCVIAQTENFKFNYASQISNILNEKNQLSGKDLRSIIVKNYKAEDLGEQEITIFNEVLLRK